MAEDKSDEWFSQVKVTSHKKWTLWRNHVKIDVAL